MDPKAYKKGLAELLSQEIPQKMAERKRYLIDLLRFQDFLHLRYIPQVFGATAADPEMETDLKALRKRIRKAKVAMAKRLTKRFDSGLKQGQDHQTDDKMSKSVPSAVENARLIMKKRLSICAAEKLEWDETGILPQGYIRQIAEDLRLQLGLVDIESLRVAKSMLEELCVRKVAKPG